MSVGRRPPFSGHLVLAHLTRSTVQPFPCRFELSSSHCTRPGHYQRLSTKTPSGIADWQVLPVLSSASRSSPTPKTSRPSGGGGKAKGIGSDKAACRRRRPASFYRVVTTPDKKGTLPYHHRLLRYLPPGNGETSCPLSKKPGRHRTRPRARLDVTTARGREILFILGALFCSSPFPKKTHLLLPVPVPLSLKEPGVGQVWYEPAKPTPWDTHRLPRVCQPTRSGLVWSGGVPQFRERKTWPIF